MGCDRVDLGNGTSAIICSRGRAAPAQSCRWCRNKATLLCDHPLPGRALGRTCSAPLCGLHTERRGTLDLCPDHAIAQEENPTLPQVPLRSGGAIHGAEEQLPAVPQKRGTRLDFGAPENVGQLRWRAWGGCWTCRARRPDGSPLVPCGCKNPSAPFRAPLEIWEQSYAAWCTFCIAPAPFR